MNEEAFKKLSADLQELVKSIPLDWGKIQNNATDKKIDLFSCKCIDDLEFQIQNLTPLEQNYFKRRWFLWMCSKVDEYLFHKHSSVLKNPNSKDKSWDVAFNNKYKFDIKGTVVPKSLIHQFNTSNEAPLIDFYYQNQSKGIRHHIQNRLFIVHHSYKKKTRTLLLRCNWELKEKAYQKFIALINHSNINFYNYKNVLAKCIFILEDESGNCTFKIN